MNKFMLESIKEARLGISNQHGGPFGCIITKNGVIVGRGHNTVLRDHDCTRHGEINAITDACRNLGTHDLSGCELYTTSAPCPMCSGAIQWANITKVYTACSIKDAERIGFRDKQFFENPAVIEELDHEEGIKLFDEYSKLDHTLYQYFAGAI